jgi:hypothetical protein
MVRRCAVPRCGGVALHGTLCDFHALQQVRRRRESVAAQKAPQEMAERTREFRVWAAVLGIELDELVDTEAPVQKGRSQVS